MFRLIKCTYFVFIKASNCWSFQKVKFYLKWDGTFRNDFGNEMKPSETTNYLKLKSLCNRSNWAWIGPEHHYLRLRKSLLPDAAAVAVDGVDAAVLTQSHSHLSTRGPAAFNADEQSLQVSWQSFWHIVAPSSSVLGLHVELGDGIAWKQEHSSPAGLFMHMVMSSKIFCKSASHVLFGGVTLHIQSASTLVLQS